MAPKCTICGADDANSHVCTGDLEETYERDLRDLVARTRETLAPPPPPGDDEVSLEAPASVRAAIRAADTLIPVAQPEALLVASLEIGEPPAQWRRRLAVAAVVTAGAVAGALVWLAEGRAPMPAQQVAAAAMAAARPVETAELERAAPVVTMAPVLATADPVRSEAPRAVATARKMPALVAKPRPTAPGAPAAAPAAPTAQPSLLDAIIHAAASGHPAPAGGPPTR